MRSVTIIRKTMSVYDRNKLERTEADLMKAEAELEYVAMMADVELPNEEEHNNVRED